MLNISNLEVLINDKKVLNGLNLQIETGKVYAIMGPNGSGKSTLSKVIAGHPSYVVQKGKIEFEINLNYKNIQDMAPEERAREGIFLGFQYPIEVPGVSNLHFLKKSFDAICKHQGTSLMSDSEFLTYVHQKAKLIGLDPSFIERSVNEGFSGGEKKRNEILQMAVLSPRLIVLDEIDSGLDIDALKAVAEGINKMRSSGRSIVMITHYQRLLDYVKPDFVHVLAQGKIAKSGDYTLAQELEKTGYDKFLELH